MFVYFSVEEPVCPDYKIIPSIRYFSVTVRCNQIGTVFGEIFGFKFFSFTYYPVNDAEINFKSLSGIFSAILLMRVMSKLSTLLIILGISNVCDVHFYRNLLLEVWRKLNL